MKDTYDFSTAKRGAVAPTKGKTRITIMLDDVVLEAARQRADKLGMGYQTLINSILKQALCDTDSNPGNPVLSEIFSALTTLADGQEQLIARLDSSMPPPLGDLARPTQRMASMLSAREEPGPLGAQLKGKAKAAAKKTKA